MSEVRTLIETLVGEGVDPVTAAEVVARAMVEGARSSQPQRSKAAERQARYRERNKASQNVTDRNGVTISDGEQKEKSPPAPPLKKNTPLEPTVLPPVTGDGKKLTPRQHLETVLSPQQAENLLDHRQRIRKPLTAHAARLLAGKFSRCRDPGEAVDAMIANGWQGFEPEWMENRKQVNGKPDSELERYRQRQIEKRNRMLGQSV